MGKKIWEHIFSITVQLKPYQSTSKQKWRPYCDQFSFSLELLQNLYGKDRRLVCWGDKAVVV